MNLEFKIDAASWRKALSIILMVSMSIGFSVSGALANGCQGGVDCLICSEVAHPHALIPQEPTENQGCKPVGPDGACGVETGQRQDEFDGVASFVRTYNQASSGIVTAVLHPYGPSQLARAFFSEFLFSEPGGATAIYLLNQSLLC